MDFDWHPARNEKIRAERGFDFADAVIIFAGRVVEHVDVRRDYGEVRIVAVGRTADGAFVTVVYVEHGETRRIVTAWPSNRKERARWYA